MQYNNGTQCSHNRFTPTGGWSATHVCSFHIFVQPLQVWNYLCSTWFDPERPQSDSQSDAAGIHSVKGENNQEELSWLKLCEVKQSSDTLSWESPINLLAHSLVSLSCRDRPLNQDTGEED